MDSVLRQKCTFKKTIKEKKNTRNFVPEYPEAHSWTNLYPRLRIFRKAKPLDSDLQGPEEGFQEKKKGLF